MLGLETYLFAFLSIRKYNLCSEFLILSAVVIGLVSPWAAAEADPIWFTTSPTFETVSL